MRLKPLCLSFALLAASAAPLLAHEFWIDPEVYMIEPGDQLVADIRVGQNFNGSALTYLKRNFERFDLVRGDAVAPVEGRMGDRPALRAPAGEAGLVVVVHQTADSFLSYSEAAKFEDFVRHKDFAWALDRHKARGLPETGFRERYSRYAKSLIAVGDGAGADAPVGMLTEIVALANPYTDDLSGGLPVQVFYQGKPRDNVQVEVFARAPDGAVTVATYRTDAEGKATLPVQAGTEYLVDAVVMRAIEPVAENDPVWESLWAALTFKVPPRQ